MDDYTGIWISERDHFPFAIVSCEHLSDDAESSFSTLECRSIDHWKEIVFIVYDDWIVKRTNVITNETSDVIGKYRVNGEIEWFGGFTNENLAIFTANIFLRTSSSVFYETLREKKD